MATGASPWGSYRRSLVSAAQMRSVAIGQYRENHHVSLPDAVFLCGLSVVVGACNDGPPGNLTDPEPTRLQTPAVATSSGPTLEGGWRVPTSLVPARDLMAASVLGESIVVVGGEDNTYITVDGFVVRRPISRVDAYNVRTKTWTPLKSLPTPRSWLYGASTIRGKLYVTGGTATGISSSDRSPLYVYDPTTNTWTRKADVPLRTVCLGVQAPIDGLLYLYTRCGDVNRNPEGTFVRYNPRTDRWVFLPVPPMHQGQPMGGAINGKFYLTGGEDEFARVTGALDVYDPGTRTWTRKSPMLVAREGAFAAVYSGKLFIAGGLGGDPYGPISSLEAYDPTTATWSMGPSMPTARFQGTAAMAGGKFFTIGGMKQVNGLASSKVEAFVAAISP
jgi:Kelch motif